MNASGLGLIAYARVSDVLDREGPPFVSETDQFARCRSCGGAYRHKLIEKASDLTSPAG